MCIKRVAVLSFALILLAGCVRSQINVKEYPVTEPEVLRNAQPSQPRPYILRIGDEVEVVFYYHSELNSRMRIRPDGMISLPLVDDILAAGNTPEALDETLTEIYRQRFDPLDLTVVVREYMPPSIYVDGEVKNPSALPLRERMNVMQAITAVGGAKDTADLRSVILIRSQNETDIQVASLDLNDIHRWHNVILQPDDIVYVPQSEIAQANQWVQQYLSNIVPDFLRLNAIYNLNAETQRNITVTNP